MTDSVVYASSKTVLFVFFSVNAMQSILLSLLFLTSFVPFLKVFTSLFSYLNTRMGSGIFKDCLYCLNGDVLFPSYKNNTL